MTLKKRLGKKGFTLVEIIVVLVILAILAAIMVPSMVGWIKKAQDKSALVAGRTILLATQTLVSENYPSTTPPGFAEIAALAAISDFTAISGITIDSTIWTVTGFTATIDGANVIYDSTAAEPYTISGG